MAYQPEGHGKTWGECSTCGFFDRHHTEEDKYAQGECRRHAPVPFLANHNIDTTPRLIAIWPEVNELDGCGEYERFEPEGEENK